MERMINKDLENAWAVQGIRQEKCAKLEEENQKLKEEKQELEYLGDINEELKEENKKLKERINELEATNKKRTADNWATFKS